MVHFDGLLNQREAKYLNILVSVVIHELYTVGLGVTELFFYDKINSLFMIYKNYLLYMNKICNSK